jgi:hypothetical protein
MKKTLLVLTAALALVFALTGCTRQNTPNDTQTTPDVSTPIENEIVTDDNTANNDYTADENGQTNEAGDDGTTDQVVTDNNDDTVTDETVTENGDESVNPRSRTVGDDMQSAVNDAGNVVDDIANGAADIVDDTTDAVDDVTGSARKSTTRVVNENSAA